MCVDRIIFPIQTLGPGSRIALWVMGCPHKCNGCANPELWEVDRAKNLPANKLIRIIKGIIEKYEVNGITVTGGEPMAQATSLHEVLNLLDLPNDFDVLVFTGYTMDELSGFRNKKIDSLLAKIDVLVDGRYMNARNSNSPLRGSNNQNIIYLNEGVREKYESYLQKGRQIQNLFYENSLISIGIHGKGQI